MYMILFWKMIIIRHLKVQRVRDRPRKTVGGRRMVGSMVVVVSWRGW